MNTDEKVKLAIMMCEDKHHNFNNYYHIYPFATENIKGYINTFDFKNKSLLTIGSSGDQVLNAINAGCKDITVFDICPFTREYLYLKAAAIHFMNPMKFFEFFSYRNYQLDMFKNKRAFTDTVFPKLLSNLKDMDRDVYFFWNQLFKRYRGMKIRTRLFMRNEYNYKAISKMNNYLYSSDNFKKLRERIDIIKDINFIQGDIFKDNIDGIYDNINLSNVVTCYEMDKFMDLFWKMEALLNLDGKMLAGYLYDTEEGIYTDEHGIYNISESLKRFPEGTKIEDIMGVNGYVVGSTKDRDSVITYKKVKKISKFC